MLTWTERNANRKTRASTLQAADIEDDDSILFQASSSGFVPPTYEPRARRSVSSEAFRGRARSTRSPSTIELSQELYVEKLLCTSFLTCSDLSQWSPQA